MWWHSIVCSLSLLCRFWVSSVVFCTSGGVLIGVVYLLVVYLLMLYTYWLYTYWGGVLISVVYLLRWCTYWCGVLIVGYVVVVIYFHWWFMYGVLVGYVYVVIYFHWWFMYGVLFGYVAMVILSLLIHGWFTLTCGSWLEMDIFRWLSYDLGIRFVLGSCVMIGYVELVLDWVFLFFVLFYLLE